MRKTAAIVALWALLISAIALAAPMEKALVRPFSDSGKTGLAQNFGLNVIEDYGAFMLVENDASVLSKPELLRIATVTPLREWDIVKLSPNFSVLNSSGQLSITRAGLFIVHFHGPIKAEWVQALLARGVSRVVQYMPNYALIVDVPAGKTITFHDIPAVDWVGELQPLHKVSPHIKRLNEVKEGDAKIILINNQNLQHTLQSLRAIGVSFVNPMVTKSQFVHVTAHGTADMVAPVSRLDGVLWIEPYLPMELHDEAQGQILAGNYTGTIPNGPGYKAWLTSVGLNDVSSVIVDVADDGWDTGDLVVGNHHPDFDDASANVRILYQTDTCGDGNHGVGGHGTINQSIVLGDGAGIGLTDANGYFYGTGMAPTARGGHTKIFTDGGSFCPATMEEITSGAAANGAVITSNSWGSRAYGGYTADSQRYDELVRDADADSSNGLYAFSVIFAAGNSGPATTEIGAPATAKNVITSGASENVRDHGIMDGCDDSNADSLNDITDFTSPGPCEDGRIKPDAMAPGNHIMGAASLYTGFDGSSVCGGPGNDFAAPPDDAYYPAGQTFYTWSSGTSHSAPAMAGAAALIYKYYQNEHGATPSPAMVKAVMLGSSDDMAGGADGNGGTTLNYPDIRQGWGRVNVGRAFDPAFKYYYDQGFVFTSTGQDHFPEPIFSVVDPTLPVKIMMVYSDAPGDPNATPSGGLANDLDLEVTVGASVFLGNNFTGGFSVTGGTADVTNNVEGVFFPAGAAATFTLRVIGTNLAADAIPGDANVTDQDYALYIYNATNQTSAGIIQMNREIYNCADAILITVSDADLQGNGTQDVTIESTTEVTPETVTLNEVTPGSGVFQGTIVTTFAPPAVDGLLSVSHGDTITATYNDADDGTVAPPVTRAPAVVTDTSTADCLGPVISNVQIINITHNSAVVTWDTDEPATSLVIYGDSPALGNVAGSPALVTSHSVLLTNLLSCTVYFVEVSSTDVALNTVVDNNNGAFYTFETLGMFDFFMDDVESGNAGWASDAPWAIIDTDGYSPIHSWTDSPGGDYDNDLEISLTSGIFDLSSYSGGELTFWHHHEIETGWDYGFAEVSDDGGTTWTTVGSYTGTLGTWTEEVTDVSAFAGTPTFQVRFRLQTDYIYGWDGWYVDDVKLSVPVSCHAGIIQLDRDVYTCDLDTINITVMDMDLNSDINVQETVTIQIVSTTEGAGESVILTEQGVSSSIFTGQIVTTSGAVAVDGLLSLTDGDTITASYDDADTGSGTPATVTDTATAFCTPLVISNVAAVVNGTSVTITWDTSRDADSLVTYDPAMPPATTEYDPVQITNHSVTISGLLQCTDYYFFVISTDQYGISATDDNLGAYYMFTTGTLNVGTYTSTDTPVTIIDNSDNISTIAVPDNKMVMDVNVTVNITHTWDSDLDIYLIAPDGTQVELSSDNGSMDDNYTGTIFDDEAATPITGGGAPFTGSFIPETALSQVDGISALGDWQLNAYDDTTGDTGSIDSWSLEILFPSTSCGPDAGYLSHTFTDACVGGGVGSGDGIADPGESLLLTVNVTNIGSDPLTGVSATLSSATPGVTVNVAASAYPDIALGANAPNNVLFDVTISDTFVCGDLIDFQIDITTNEGTFVDTFQQRVGFFAVNMPVLSEDFETWPPAGWTIIDNIATHPWDSTNVTGRVNDTGGSGAAADADSDYWATDIDSELITPVVDLTLASTATLEYECHFENYGSDDYAYTDITTDGGTTWTNLRTEDIDDGMGHHVSIDLTPYVGNMVQIRFHYTTVGGWEWYWMVDQVEVLISTATAACNVCFTAGCAADLGDVNLMNGITSLDASLVLQEVVGLITFTPEETCRADVNENLNITSLDAAYILMCTVGNCPGLPLGFEPSCNSHGNCL